MERIYYAGSSFLMSDDIANAVIDYHEYLIGVGGSAAFTVPVEYTDGTVGRLNMLLSPTSVLGFEAEDGTEPPSLRDDATVDFLRKRMSAASGGNRTASQRLR